MSVLKTTTYDPPRTDGFVFSLENKAKADDYRTRYPEDRQASAVLWLLYLAQEQNGGWLSNDAIEYVAAELDMAPIRVYEVATFYTMFNLRPVGRYLVQVCRTTSCWMRGSDAITKACLEEAGTGALGEVSEDGVFSVVEVECLGACCNAPMFQVNDRDYFEDLTPESARAVMAKLRAGEEVKPGSQSGRAGSEPQEGAKTLLHLAESPAQTGEGA